ncbi:MAG: SRPBCC domain-containing protein [Taibaiella sp.]|nr:SRPBCC domain-containing protein [Taibaiella sp.]
MAYDLSLEFQLSAAPDRVMQLLTDAVLIRKWSGGEAILENKVGGEFMMFDGWATGNVLKTGASELAYTWKTTDWAEDTAPTEVHYLLKKHDGGTKVTITHTGLPNEDEMKSHRSGWTDYFFDPMEDYIMIFEQD